MDLVIGGRAAVYALRWRLPPQSSFAPWRRRSGQVCRAGIV